MQFLILPAILMILWGCGTTHYFMPPQPLDDGEWRLSFVWHADLANLQGQSALIFPSVNGWLGLGKRYNLGIGTSFLWPSHISMAHYDNIDGEDFNIAYVNLQPLSVNNNPIMELGYGRSFGTSSAKQTAAVGIGFGVKEAWELGFHHDRAGFFQYLDLMPLIALRYSIAGGDVGFSYAHYHGLTKRLIRNSFPDFENDTTIVISYFDVDSVVQSPEKWKYWAKYLITIWRENNPAEEIWAVSQPPDPYISPDDFFHMWTGNRFALFYPGKMVVDLEEIKNRDPKDSTLVLYRYPESFKKAVRDIKWYWRDHTFGFGIMNNPE